MSDQASGYLSPWLRRKRIAAAMPFLTGRVLDYGCGVGALAGHLPAGVYLGVDADRESLDLARHDHPQHSFADAIPPAALFDTIVALAVIEHVEDPGGFLKELGRHLDAGGRIVLTTPHPSVRAIHDLGSRIGLFSRAAAEEHHILLDERALRRAGQSAGLRVVLFRRFLAGANQLGVFAPWG